MAKFKGITEHKIWPSDIDTKKHPYEAFDKMEREEAAMWLVRFAKKRGNWESFTVAEYEATMGHDIHLWGLDDMGLIVVKDGRYYFTHEFITTIWAKCPT